MNFFTKIGEQHAVSKDNPNVYMKGLKILQLGNYLD